MKHTCELCRNFCSALHDLRIEGNEHLVGRIGPCCVQIAAQRVELLVQRHPERRHDALSIAEFRELTRPQRPRSANTFGRPRREP
jgi:hypothetical protein